MPSGANSFRAASEKGEQQEKERKDAKGAEKKRKDAKGAEKKRFFSMDLA